VHFYESLMAQARQAILEDRYSDFAGEFAEAYGQAEKSQSPSSSR
jgi:queuine/archaeosine tRNA-ribosyltransferase